jgi:hypothetical protein
MVLGGYLGYEASMDMQNILEDIMYEANWDEEGPIYTSELEWLVLYFDSDESMHFHYQQMFDVLEQMKEIYFPYVEVEEEGAKRFEALQKQCRACEVQVRRTWEVVDQVMKLC